MIGSRAGNQVNELLSIISDPGKMKERVERLRAAQATHDAARKAAIKAAADLKGLKDKEADLAQREAALAAQSDDLRSREASLATVNASFNALRAQHERVIIDAHSELDAKRADLDKRANETRALLAQEKQAADASYAAANRRLDDRARAIDDREHALRQQELNLENAQAAFAADRARFEKAQAEHAARVEQLRKLLP